MKGTITTQHVFDNSQFILGYWKNEGYTAIELVGPKNAPGRAVSPAHQAFLQLEHSGNLPFNLKGYVGRLQNHGSNEIEVGVFIPVSPDHSREKMKLTAQRTVISMRALALSQGRRDILPQLLSTSRDSMEIMLDGVCLAEFGVFWARTHNGLGTHVYGTVLREPVWSETWVG